jgi:hypothetical protein
MKVWVVYSHAHVQRLVSAVKMAVVLEGCTTEAKRSFVRFFFFVGKVTQCKGYSQRNVSHVKRFSLSGKCFADEEEVEIEVRKWLRQQ